MREFSFSHSVSDPASQAKFQAEILDLRVDILKGLLIPWVMLGWGGMAYGLALSSERPDWVTTITFGVVLITSMACIAINAAGRTRIALWWCTTSMWVTALSHFLIKPDTFGLLWVGTACVLYTILIGPASGWVAAIVSALGFAGYTYSTAEAVTLDHLLASVTPLAALVFITHMLSRALFQTLRWMSEGYSLAHEQADQMRNQSAELSGALKSLGQTSFALARANEQLEIMAKYAEDARRSKQEFAASISHELRTPLNLIIGFSDVILNAPETYNLRRLPVGLLADIHVIRQNAQHLLKLVNDILDMSQMDVAYMTITREPMHIDGFIQTALQDFAQLIESRGLTLSIKVAPELPEVYADKTRIRQVLLNLVNNAMRFTDEGGIIVSACLSSGSPARIVISVKDTGVGIAPEDLQRIFEPFTKIDQSHKHLGGTGLGLTISKRFVELHGGRMWVESAMGKGSTFFFTLPLIPPSPEALTQGTLRQVHRQEIGALAIVERQPLLSRLLEHRLEGIKVLLVRSIDELLEQCAISLPEAIIINQPPQTLNNQKLSQLKNVPIITCYVPDMPDVLAQDHPPAAPDLKATIRRYLIKPITRDRLYEVLNEILSARPAVMASRTHAPNVTGFRSARFLVVEDDEDALHLLGRMLRSAPEEVRHNYDALIPIEMRSGEQALEFLRASAAAAPDTHNDGTGNRIEGVLLDLRLGEQLGERSGLDVLHAIDGDPALRDIPVCVVSGQETPGDILMSSHLTLLRQPGLSARELTQAIAALMQITLPGVDVVMH
ncbi:MAG: ATP-binding protein [Chloroflexi bacterium]|nr:ATP-binding protein [Chloroflexota bacterium]